MDCITPDEQQQGIERRSLKLPAGKSNYSPDIMDIIKCPSAAESSQDAQELALLDNLVRLLSLAVLARDGIEAITDALGLEPGHLHGPGGASPSRVSTRELDGPDSRLAVLETILAGRSDDLATRRDARHDNPEAGPDLREVLGQNLVRFMMAGSISKGGVLANAQVLNQDGARQETSRPLLGGPRLSDQGISE